MAIATVIAVVVFVLWWNSKRLPDAPACEPIKEPQDIDVIVATLKGVTLVGLVEHDIIKRQENGGVQTESFEKFWEWYEKQIKIMLWGIR